MARIALIGAGSVTPVRRLLADLFSRPELEGTTVVLHDPDGPRLATAEATARRMADRSGTDARVEVHTDRRRALAGADYVITALDVGGRAAAQVDVDVPARFGVRRTVAGTLGVGGIFRALRTVPILRGIGHELAEVAPDALLLEHTGPMTTVPRAIAEGTPFTRVVGLCPSARDAEARLARLVGVPREECAMVTAGVNHQAFVLRFTHGGRDLYPVLSAVLDADPDLGRTVPVEMFRRLGYFPTGSGGHGGPDPGSDGSDGPEPASEVIHSIETGTPRVVHATVRNDGLITNLPAEASVEVPCHVDRAGVRPLRVGALPPQLAALNSMLLNVGELTLRAALDGRRDHVYHAAMLDPHTATCLTPAEIHELVDAMFDAHHDLLPVELRRDRRAPTAAGAPAPAPAAGASLTGMVPSEEAASAHPLYDLPLRRWEPRTQLRVPAGEVAAPRFPVIDAHNHLGRWLTDDGSWMVADPAALVDLMDRCGVRAMVNLCGRFGAELAENLARYDEAYPGRFATFCHVDWEELSAPGFGERIAAGLRASVGAGAKGLKVWKDLGLHRRDHDGRLVLLDDDRLAPLWAEAASLGIPVAVHTADPKAFFDPVDEHNERLEQLLRYPQWSFADPRFPSFERLIDAFETVVAAHPGTTFVGVHGGCYPENLGRVGEMLDRYPNYHIDISARLAELGRQPRATRDLFTRHRDRVLFGTDRFPPDGRSYRLHYRFLESRDEKFPHDPDGDRSMGRWDIDGLGLDDDTLRAVYAGNAARLVPALAGAVRPAC